MTRAWLSSIIGIALSVGGASEAHAQSTLPGASPIVRAHFRNAGKTSAHVYAPQPDGSWSLLCATPCTADVPAGKELRATIGGHEDEPHSFVVGQGSAPEVDIEVRPGSSGSLVGGIVMLGAGGGLALSGLVFLALANGNVSASGSRVDHGSSSPTETAVGGVMIGVGAAVMLGGALLLYLRSHEPRVREAPSRGAHLSDTSLRWGITF